LFCWRDEKELEPRRAARRRERGGLLRLGNGANSACSSRVVARGQEQRCGAFVQGARAAVGSPQAT